jgi:hypothetical protein
MVQNQVIVRTHATDRIGNSICDPTAAVPLDTGLSNVQSNSDQSNNLDICWVLDQGVSSVLR